MAFEVTVRFPEKRFRDRLRQLEVDIMAATTDAMADGLERLRKKFIRDRLSNTSIGPKGLVARTKRLQRALSWAVTGRTLRTLKGRIGFGDANDQARKAIQHEIGGPLRSKGKLMRIPLRAALDPSGNKLNIPPFAPDTFLRKGTIFRRLPGDKLEALFVLRRQVHTPARLGFRRFIRDNQNVVTRAIRERISKLRIRQSVQRFQTRSRGVFPGGRS